MVYLYATCSNSLSTLLASSSCLMVCLHYGLHTTIPDEQLANENVTLSSRLSITISSHVSLYFFFIASQLELPIGQVGWWVPVSSQVWLKASSLYIEKQNFPNNVFGQFSLHIWTLSANVHQSFYFYFFRVYFLSEGGYELLKSRIDQRKIFRKYEKHFLPKRKVEIGKFLQYKVKKVILKCWEYKGTDIYFKRILYIFPIRKNNVLHIIVLNT